MHKDLGQPVHSRVQPAEISVFFHDADLTNWVTKGSVLSVLSAQGAHTGIYKMLSGIRGKDTLVQMRSTDRRVLRKSKGTASMAAFCAPVLVGRFWHVDRRPADSPRPTRPYHRRTCPRATIRDLPLLTIPMTSGGDVLFPGGMQQIPIDDENASRLLDTACNNDPPEFAHLVINAWNEPGTVGTIATVQDLSTSSNMLHCTGTSRFRVLHLADDYSSARVETFQDDPPEEPENEKLEQLEKELLQTMASIVTLSLKIAGEDRQKALAETLRRVETFCGMDDDDRDWLDDLHPDRRRELLSFIVIDLLSISFMNRREILSSTNTAERLEHAQTCLQPFVNELAAKGAIVSALGHEDRNN